MFAFFFRNNRIIFSFVMVSVIASMLFYGTGASKAPAIKEVKETLYHVGPQQKEKEISKTQIESMKTYLSYDFGYDINDALERQNVFADGFFVELMDSSFGAGLVEKFFPLLKEDFAKRVAIHSSSRLYSHPSGKLHLEDELKVYRKELVDKYRQVKEKGREIDESLLKDYLSLQNLQRSFRPRDMKLLAMIFIRDRRLGSDPMVERKNFALFQAKSNEEVLGKAFMELAAQAVLAGSIYAEEHGYSTSYEEAKGVVIRRALDVLGTKFSDIQEKSVLVKLKNNYMEALGLSEKNLVEAARSIMTFQKMIKDVDTTLLLDTLSVQKLYGDQVETLLVKMVQDSSLRTIRGPMEALELQCYLESIGDAEGFLSMPEKVYEESKLYENNPDLLVTNYMVKLSTISKEMVGNSISLKKVWDFQTSDKGWKEISKKFSFDASLNKNERFVHLRGMDEKVSLVIEKFSREKLVEHDQGLIEEALAQKELKKIELHYNAQSSQSDFGDGFNRKAFITLLDGMKEEEEIPYYTQDNIHFHRVLLLEKVKEKKFPMFAQAKRDGFLTAMVEKKLEWLNGGRKIEEKDREKLVHTLLKKEAKDIIALEIIAAEKEERPYTKHNEKRLEAVRNETYKISDEKLLQQFKMYEEQEVVARSGKNKEMAKEEFFKMEDGMISSIHYLDRGAPYYIHLVTKKIEEDKLTKIKGGIHSHLCIEARKFLYDKLISYIKDDNMIEMTRFKKGA